MLYRMTRYFILFIALILASFLPQESSAQDSSKEEPFNGIITDLSGNPIKDASIYGSQGANGAILVFTKRGK